MKQIKIVWGLIVFFSFCLSHGSVFASDVNDYLRCMPSIVNYKGKMISISDRSEKKTGLKLTSLNGLGKVKRPNKIEIIFIDNTSLTTVSPGAFARFKNLKYLFITRSKLKELPPDLCNGLHQLIQVDLSKNDITELPSTLL